MKEILLNSELIFWDTFIPVMKESKVIQWFIRVLYPFVEGLKINQIVKTLAITCVSGFVLGWLAIYTYYLTR